MRQLMNIEYDTQEMLNTLTQAVNEALDKKRKLNQYAVICQDDQTVIIHNNDRLADDLPYRKI